MYFDSWSTSYFFWVIICFAVWGMAGFSVYGAINVFTSRRDKYKKREPLTPEKIQELKKKAEQSAEIFAQNESVHKQFEEEKKATVKSLEAFVNSTEKIEEEKEVVSALEREILKKVEAREEKMNAEEALQSSSEQTEIDHIKLKEIYEKELKIAEEINSAKKTIKAERKETSEETPLKEELKAEEKNDEAVKQHWKELDDVFRTAFRS